MRSRSVVLRTVLGALLAGAACSDPSGLADTPAKGSAPIRVARLSIAPDTATIGPGASLQLTATALDSANHALTGRAVTWSTSNQLVATVSSDGRVTALAQGAAIVTASCEGVQDSVSIFVRRTVYAVTVSPSVAAIVAGDTVRLTATPHDTMGAPLAGRAVAWFSSNTTIATVDTSGLVRGVSQGRVTISATAEVLVGTADLTVDPQGPPTEVGGIWDWTETFRDNGASCSDTGSYVFNQSGRFFDGLSFQVGGCAPVYGPDSARSDPVFAGRAYAGGLVFQVGGCTYTATVVGATPDSVNGTADCAGSPGTWYAVRAVPGGSIKVTPPSMTVPVHASVQLAAILRNASGNRAFGRPISWSSDVPGVATVSDSGLITAVATGSAAIHAAAGTAQAAVPVNVQVGVFKADSVGDAFGTMSSPDYDVSYVSATRDSLAVTFVFGFTEVLDRSSLGGYIDFDLDQDSTTGTSSAVDGLGPPGATSGLGDEYFYDLFINNLISTADGSAAEVAPLIQDSTLTLRLPLALLGGDDGYLNFAAIFGNQDEATDIVPNTGHIAITGPAAVRAVASRGPAARAFVAGWRPAPHAAVRLTRRYPKLRASGAHRAL